MDATNATRIGWDEYFLGIAAAVARRADCSRRRVGAVVVRDRRIVSTGYNGAPAGRIGCLSGGCPRASSDVSPGSSYDTGAGSCVAVHAEANALLYGGRDRMVRGTLYTTDEPCDGCWRLIRAAGLRTVHAGNERAWVTWEV